MLLIQLFGIFVGSSMILYSYLSYRKGKIGMYSTIFWVIIWGSLIYVSVLPTDQWYIQRISGVTTFSTAIVAVIIIIFAFIYRLSVQIHRVNNRLAELVQKIAIEEKIEPKKKTK